ncbi:MAG: DUF1801 domain-containing protein [Erysipelothrix sp.]|jgi:hypothetical protein|nr:DUF1801 domain-containing protein [Erysipelothrix sp.]
MQKTVPLDIDVQAYIETLDEKKKADAYTLLEVFREETQEEATLWRGNMIGFGTYQYRYDSGHEGYAMKCGFAFRKTNMTLYLYTEFDYNNPDYVDELLTQLGKFTHGRVCIYVKKLSDINLDVLRQLIQRNQKFIEDSTTTIRC